MRKIKTIFDRDWEGNRKVIDKYIDDIDSDIMFVDILRSADATEKLDGMNVRITVRNHEVVRAEKRRNPDKIQKKQGIVEPWYVDADELDPQDKWIFDGINTTNFAEIPDGEWSGELIGKNIQGNPLNLDDNRIVFFSLNQAPIFYDVPITYAELKEWLPKQKSKYGNDCKIEGIVWHCGDEGMYKIKLKDF